MDIVTSTSPEVANLLWLDITCLEWGARKGWGRNLKDRQRYGEVARQRLSDTRNGGNQWRQRDLPRRDLRLCVWNGRGACHIGERNECKK